MASSRVMLSTSSAANSDLGARQLSSMYSMTLADHQRDPSASGDPAKPLISSKSMDDLLSSIYGDDIPTPQQAADGFPGGEASESAGGDSVPQPLAKDESFSLLKSLGAKTVEEVWKEISAGGGGDGEGSGCKEGSDQQEMMTLEDFLEKAGAVRAEDVRVPPAAGFSRDPAVGGEFVQQGDFPAIDFGDAMDGGGRSVARGRKRPLMDLTDRAAMQKQKRMIKNRESAARSRERKQAYTVELETLVAKLEEENAVLIREQEEQHKMRLRQLLENLIPVTEKKKPPRVLKRTKSMLW